MKEIINDHNPHFERDNLRGWYDQGVKPPDFSDAGNTVVFARRYRDRLIHTDSLGWLRWDGMRWVEDNHAAIELAQDLTADILDDAKRELSEAQKNLHDVEACADESEEGRAELAEAQKTVKSAQSYFAFAMRSRGAARIQAIERLAVSILTIPANMLDADAYILNTPSGRVDLRTGKIEPSCDPKAYCTKVTAAAPGSQGMEEWLAFLNTITCGDASIRGYLQQVIGSACIGKVFVEQLVLAFGCGRNGKSSLFDAVAAVLGDYAGTTDADIFVTSGGNKKAAMAALRGKRLVICGELDEGEVLSSKTLKRVATTGNLTVERKFHEQEDVRPSHHVVMYTNFLPKVFSRDAGTWRRLYPCPFNATISERDAVQDYASVLAERCGPAILSWCIQGAMLFCQNDCKIKIPDAVAVLAEEWRAREDWLERFLNECCVFEPGGKVQASVLYKTYRAWAEDNGERIRPNIDFSAAMQERGFSATFPQNKKFWHGMRLNGPASPWTATG